MPDRLLLPIPLILLLTIVSQLARAEIYIYQGPNGERLVTDRPPHGSKEYRLISRRDTITNAGHILANRPIRTGGSTRFAEYIRTASNHFNIDPALVEAVIQVESGFDPNAVSKKGATGLMQLMRKTARHHDVIDRFNPRENIYAGVEHLSELMKRFDGQLPLVLAAYNAGSSAVERHRGVPPFPETKRYVDKVLSYRDRYRQRYSIAGN